MTSARAMAAPKTPKSGREKFDPQANSKRDLQIAIIKARQGNKRIILDVGGEWCSWCREMDNFLLRNAGLQSVRDRNYVWLKINFSEENSNQEFLSAYPKIEGYPHLFVLDKNGKLLLSKDTAQLEDGKHSYDLQKFSEFLTRYAPPKSAAR